MQPHLTRAVGVLFVLVLFVQLPAAAPLLAAGLPPDFSDALVTNLDNPTALAFTPDGRLLIAQQTGQLRVYAGGALLATPALDLTVGDKICNDTNTERGLLGVAIDPQFSTNHAIYLYYTFKKFGVCPAGDPTNPNIPVNRVSRYTLGDNNLATGEQILIDNILSPNGNHNGGDLHFGQDGYLYVSIGDGGADYNGDSGAAGDNDATRDQFILLGKVLRITRDGGIPADNPFQGADSGRCNLDGRTTKAKCQETFAWGSATLSASHSSPARASCISTMSGRAHGKRSMSGDRGPTTAGTVARACIPTAPPASAARCLPIWSIRSSSTGTAHTQRRHRFKTAPRSLAARLCR